MPENNKSKNETLYRGKYGKGWTSKVWLTSDEMNMSEADLAAKISSSKALFFKPQEPKTACQALNEMLHGAPKMHVQNVGGGVGVGATSNGNSAVVYTWPDQIKSYDEDTNAIVRAY